MEDPLSIRTAVFIRGLWVSRELWSPWCEMFAAAGFETHAPGYPGEGTTVDASRDAPDAQSRTSTDEIVRHFAGIIGALPGKPVVVGHSFGALVAEKLLWLDLASAAVAIDPPPIGGSAGLPFAHLHAAFPELAEQGNARTARALTENQFRYVFGFALSRVESHELWQRWGIPSTSRPLFESATMPRPDALVSAPDRGPLLIVSSDSANEPPGWGARARYMGYEHPDAATDYLAFDGRGHSSVMDAGWQDLADASLAWLKKHERPSSGEGLGA